MYQYNSFFLFERCDRISPQNCEKFTVMTMTQSIKTIPFKCYSNFRLFLTTLMLACLCLCLWFSLLYNCIISTNDADAISSFYVRYCFFELSCIKICELNGHCGQSSEHPAARPNESIVSRINWPIWAAKCHFVGVEYCHTNDNVVDLKKDKKIKDRNEKRNSIIVLLSIWLNSIYLGTANA